MPPRYAVYGTVVIGALLRVLYFVKRPSLTLDEARLALNVVARTIPQLAAPLDHDQSAPLLFLWGERLMVHLFGANELALRLLPLLAGIALLAAAYPMMRRVLGGHVALFGVAILAVAPAMVAYSNEIKQYMLETLVATVLTALALAYGGSDVDDDSVRSRTLCLLGAAGVVGVWLSASAIFVLAAIASVLLLGRRPAPSKRRARLAVCVAWALSFGLAYLLVYRVASGSPYMARFWKPAFLTPSPDVLQRSWLALAEFIWGFVAGHSGVPRAAEADQYVQWCAVIGALCMVVGVGRLRRRVGSEAVVVLLGPALLALVASMLQFYPVGQRLLLFVIPSLLAVGLAGVQAGIGRLGEHWRRPMWLAVGGLIAIPLLAITVLQATIFDTSSRARDLISTLTGRRQAGEPVYIFSRTVPAWEFYSTDWSARNPARVAFFNRIARAGGPGFENAPSRHRPVAASEGVSLVFRASAGDELAGLPTGMEYLAARGLLQPAPDTGWYAREADRIQSAASPTVWILMTEFFGPEYQLLDELERRGARITYREIEPGHVLVRFEVSGGVQPWSDGAATAHSWNREAENP